MSIHIINPPALHTVFMLTLVCTVFVQVVGQALPYESTAGVRARLAQVAPHFAVVNAVQKPVWLNGEVVKGLEALAAKQVVQASKPLSSPITNFYMTDAISRASATMAKCVLARQN